MFLLFEIHIVSCKDGGWLSSHGNGAAGAAALSKSVRSAISQLVPPASPILLLTSGCSVIFVPGLCTHTQTHKALNDVWVRSWVELQLQGRVLFCCFGGRTMIEQQVLWEYECPICSNVCFPAVVGCLCDRSLLTFSPSLPPSLPLSLPLPLSLSPLSLSLSLSPSLPPSLSPSPSLSLSSLSLNQAKC